MKYVMAHLMFEMSKRKAYEPEGDDAAIMLHQGKVDNPSWRKDVRTCYYCGKLRHIACICSKAKYKGRENTNDVKDNNDYALATLHATHSKAICIWIIDSGATKRMTFQKVAIDTYKVIAPCNVLLGDDSALEVIGMASIIVELLVRDKIKRIGIKNALHVPKLQANLLLVSKLLSNGLKV